MNIKYLKKIRQNFNIIYDDSGVTVIFHASKRVLTYSSIQDFILTYSYDFISKYANHKVYNRMIERKRRSHYYKECKKLKK